MSVEDDVMARLELIRVKQFKAEVVVPPPPHVVPKKYVLLAWYWHSACGGLGDMVDSFDTIEEAVGMAHIEDPDSDADSERFQVVDRDTWEVVAEG